MNRKLIVKIGIDLCMTVSLLLLMPYSLLGETAHEWIGMAMFLLFIVHHVLNRRWLASMTRGRYTPLRVVQTILVLVMLVLMIGSMVSGILLSNHIFQSVRIAGISEQTVLVHILCAYWGFVVMSMHLGIHWNMVVVMCGRLFAHPSKLRAWIARIVAAVTAGYGLYAFGKRQFSEYLFMKMHFAFYDFSEPVFFFIGDYVAAMVMIAFTSYYIVKFLRKAGK